MSSTRDRSSHRARSSAPRRAAIYLRISLNATREGLAIERQRDICTQIVEQRGWETVAEFVDNSISASDQRKNRPGYDALVTAYAAREFDALVCYDMDRLTRQPRQMEDWLDAAVDQDLALVTANGEADLTTDAGRTFARARMAFARGEVERKAKRQRDAAFQRAQMGKPPLGVRLTGYTSQGETVPDEAAVVRRIFSLFYEGGSLKGIAHTLTKEGVPPRRVSRKKATAETSKVWNPSSVRDILTNPRYAGRVVYDGEVLDGVACTWEPLVTPEVFDVIAARLSDPVRRTSRVGTDRRHLGAGLYLCDQCGEPVSSWSGARYRCREAHVNRARGPVDTFVTDVLRKRLTREDAAQLLGPTMADLAPLLDETTRLRARLQNINDDYDRGDIDGPRFKTATARVRAELTEVEKRLAETRTGSALGSILNTTDPARAFDEASLMAQRSVLDALCEVRLRQGTRGSRTFRPETVVIIWRQ